MKTIIASFIVLATAYVAIETETTPAEFVEIVKAKTVELKNTLVKAESQLTVAEARWEQRLEGNNNGIN